MADLWAIHLLGPDDIHAAPSFEEAERACIQINAFFRDKAVKPHAVVVHWEGSSERHAAQVAEDWPKLWGTPRPAPQHGDDAGSGRRYVLCQVGFGTHYADWLLIPHADGQYVTAAKLPGFSMAILREELRSRSVPPPDAEVCRG